MRVEITGRHVDITPPLRQLIARRLAKLERLLNDSAISAGVILTKEKYRHRAEIIIHVRGDHMLRGLGDGTSWPVAVRDAAAKIEQQAQTLKGKWGDAGGAGERAREPCAAPAAPEPSARRGSCVPRGMPSSRCRSRTSRCAIGVRCGNVRRVPQRRHRRRQHPVPPHRRQLRVD